MYIFKIKDQPEKGALAPIPLQAVTGDGQPHSWETSLSTGQGKGSPETLTDQIELCTACGGLSLMGSVGKTFGEYVRLIMGCSGEEPKARMERIRVEGE